MKSNDKLRYVVAPFITAVLLLIVYAIKHIYPFGIYTIDYYDMGQQIAAFYFHIFDFLHGEKALFYDPYTALSVNMAMSTSGCSHLSIFNLFFLFVKREMLLESLSFFLMIKMMLMSLSMNIYIRNKFKVPAFYEVVFSVIYAFSGYVLLLYMTIQWLDIAILFPILMLYLHKLLSDGKIAGYIVTLTMSVVISYYLSFMILIYIVLMVGVALFCDRVFTNYRGADNKKIYGNYHLLKLLFSTVISIMLSAFILLPQMCQTLISARFNNENDGGLLSMYYGIVSTVKPAYTTRWFALFGTSFAFSVIVYGIIKYRNEKKTMLLTLLSCFIVLSEFIVEGVNLFWHFGSYVQYPIRNGFIIIFTIEIISLCFIEKSEATDDNGVASDFKMNKAIAILFSICSIALCVVLINYYRTRELLTARNVFHITFAVMLLTFIIYMMLAVYKKGAYIKLSAILIATECIFFGFIMIGKPEFSTGYTEDPEQNSEYIRICDQLDEAFNLNAVDNTMDDGSSLLFSRVKNPDTSLNANYGLALRRPVLSNWTHLLSPKLQRDAAKLGYTVQYTRLLDAGGTAFSDALIGVNQVVSCLQLDENLYTKIGSTEVTTNHETGETAEYYLYDCNYKLPFGVLVSNIDYGFEDGDTVDIYNSIYHSLCDDDENIAEYVKNDNPGEITHNNNIDIDSKKALYYFSNQVDTDDYNTVIKVNGKTVLVPSISELDNYSYPAHFNNNALYLGTFSNEKVTVEIETSDYDVFNNKIETPFEPAIVSIDLEKLSKLTSNIKNNIYKRNVDKSEYTFNVNSDMENGYVLIPLSYDEGYSVKVNGVKSEAIAASGMFIAVPVNSGDNEIVLKFTPKGMKLGLLVSMFGIVLIIAMIAVDKRNDVINKEYKWLNNLYIAGFIIVILGMYFVPYVFCVLSVVHII